MAKSKKLPALQFYPGDWKKDLGIQSLDYEARGVWFELMLMMHESPRRGYLELNGGPMPDEIIGKILGIHGNKWKKIRRKLEVSGVASVEEKTGTLFSRRMVRDEEFRQIRSKCGSLGADFGKLGGQFGKLGGRKKTPVTTPVETPQKPPPSISSSISSSYSYNNKYIPTSNSEVELLGSDPPPKTPRAKNWPPEGIEVKPNIFLTEKEIESLKQKLAPNELDFWYKQISDYIVDNELKWKKKYKNHYRVILNWRNFKLEKGYVWNEAENGYRYPAKKTEQNDDWKKDWFAEKRRQQQ